MSRNAPHNSRCEGRISWKLALILVFIIIVLGAFLSSCSQKKPAKRASHRPHPHAPSEKKITDEGLASWYGPKFNGRRTASGERYNQNLLTAAHKTLPFNSMVKVTNLSNNKEVIVRINDRGPFSRGRIIDLSKGAAKSIAMLQSGTAKVRIETVDDAQIDESTKTKSVKKRYKKIRK